MVKKDSGASSTPVTGPALTFVRLDESDEVLLNPGIGFCTYQRFNGDPTVKRNFWDDDGATEYSDFSGRVANEGHPDTTVAYFRWYWLRLEPEQGVYRWDIIDRALEQAVTRGQQLHIRVMPHDHTTLVPEWYKRRGKTYSLERSGQKLCIPDYRDPLFRSSTEKLVALLGERYASHPALCAIDIGTLGFWGEWHTGPFTDGMGDEALRRWAIDLYLQAFPKTPKMMLIAPEDGMSYAVSRGTGWRADCWGDMRTDWGHMYDLYPQQLARTGAADAWKCGPICLETCWTPIYWHHKRWDIDYIIDEALRWHASLINIKSAIVPESWREKMINFQKRLGYRYVIRLAGFPVKLSAGQPLPLKQWWVNRGVAPCYADFRLLVRLKGPGEFSCELGHDLHAWLPGDDHYLEDSITLPSDLPAGTYDLDVSVVRPGSSEPAVKTANKDRSPEGRIKLGQIEITV